MQTVEYLERLYGSGHSDILEFQGVTHPKTLVAASMQGLASQFSVDGQIQTKM